MEELCDLPTCGSLLSLHKKVDQNHSKDVEHPLLHQADGGVPGDEDVEQSHNKADNRQD